MSREFINPNDSQPDGWTENMQPLTGNTADIPSYSEMKLAEENAAQNPSQAAPQKGAVQPQQQAQQPTQGQQGQPTGEPSVEGGSDGEKYWHSEAMQLREEVARLKPLDQFSSLLDYLDKNDDAVAMVVNHMNGVRGEEGTPAGDLERELYGDERSEVNNEPAPVQTTQPQQGNNSRQLDGANAGAKRQMYSEMERLLREEGMPAHEADQHIKFMMSPGEVTPQEALQMYKTLRKTRDERTGQSTEQNPQGVNTEPAKEVAGNTNIPPMSVVGINGESDNHQGSEVVTTARDRIAMDPNNA